MNISNNIANNSPVLTLAMGLNLAKTQLQKQLDKALSTHGIGVSEFLAMTVLANGEPMSRVALADALAMSASAITKLLNPMEKVGIIQKIANEKDARQSLVALSQTGKQIHQEAQITAQSELSYHFARLNESEIETLIALLGKI